MSVLASKINRSAYKEIFWYFDTGIEGFDYPRAVKLSYRKNALSRFAIKFFHYFLPLSSFNASYLFIGSKYKDLIKGMRNDELMIAGGLKSVLYSLFLGKRPWLLDGYALMLVQIYEKYSLDNGQILLEELVKNIETILRKSNVKFIILINDSLPLERLIIESARRARIKTYCIQHGLFSSSKSVLADGAFADYILCYDEYQANIIRENPYLKSKVLIYGYHSVVKLGSRQCHSTLPRKVCFFGQPWAEYYPSLERRYYEIVENCASVLKAHGICVEYKPHPSEYKYKHSITSCIPIIDDCLMKSFKKYDYFISISSTALFEASLCGKSAIQIKDNDFVCDSFVDQGYAQLVYSNQLNALINALMSEPCVPNIHVSYDSDALAYHFKNTISTN